MTDEEIARLMGWAPPAMADPNLVASQQMEPRPDLWTPAFMTLPMSAGPRDPVVAMDDAGRDVYRTPLGEDYWFTAQGDGSVAQALADQMPPTEEPFGGVIQALAESLWDGLTAPARAARGEPLTNENVMNTTGLVAIGGGRQ